MRPWPTGPREELAKLQQGDAANTALWREFMQVSRQAFERLYARLNVHFDHWLGESFYHPMLAGVVQELREKNLAVERRRYLYLLQRGYGAGGDPLPDSKTGRRLPVCHD